MVERGSAEQLFRLQNDLLEALAGDCELPELLTQLAVGVESLAPGLLCSVLLLDTAGHLHVGAAPSLPAEFSNAVEGVPIGPKVGSCGTAAYFNRPVEVVDIATDPLWDDYRFLALPLGLAACWSTPINSRTGRVLGTFAVYYHKPRAPSDYHRQLVAICTHLAAVAIERKEADAQLHALAFFDPVTGLANRALLADRAAVALAHAERVGAGVAILFVDLDRFKNINDTLGHAVGDQLLKIVAGRLREVVREGDTICRLGGDEFVLLLQDCDSLGACQVAERVLSLVADPIILEGRVFTGSACVGISLFPEDAREFPSLLRQADMAMYQAKAAGRNNYRFFRADMNAAVEERLALEHALRDALAAQALRLHYQPKIELATGRLHSVEALARWTHPEWGLVPPVRFIPLAEECGLIGKLGQWVLDEACRQLVAWRAAGVEVPAVAINVSPVQFQLGDVPALVAGALARHGLPASALILEITESTLIGQEHSAQALTALHGLGVHLSVDDFGTGYSSLSYLQRFPVGELKLDRSFVCAIDAGNGSRELVSAILGIGQTLNLTVVAEGVETQAQLAFLQQRGCAIAQGYFFSPPLPADDLVAWLQARSLGVEVPPVRSF